MTNEATPLREALLDGFRATLDDVLPWFKAQMPPAYFADTDAREQLVHVRAVVAARASGQSPRLTLRGDDGHRWTFISDADKPGMLHDILVQLPPDALLRAVKVHTSADGQLSIDTVVIGEAPRFDPNDRELAARREAILAHARAQGGDEALVDRYLRGSSAEYVRVVTPLRAERTASLFGEVSGTDDTVVRLEPERDPSLSRVIVAAGNPTARRMAERCAALLGAHSINILRAFVDVIDDGGNGSVAVFSYVVRSPDGGAIDPDGDLWRHVSADLARMKWVTDAAIALDRRRGRQ